ncbi:hypothetical protein J4Q44_G00306040, partial [Coregonus suidteri]
ARSARICSPDWFGLHTSPPLPLLLSLRPPPLWCKDCERNVVPQDFQDQTLSRQEAETEQAHPTVDQNEDRQQDQVQFQEETLEEDKAGLVNAQVFRSPASTASSTCQEHHLLGPDLERKPYYLEQQSFCTD